MDQLLSDLELGIWHFFAALLVVGVTHGTQRLYKWHSRRKELERLSWLFPFSKERPEIQFRCSLKPSNELQNLSGNDELFQEIFGKNPSTFRKYVHSAEALALQMITEYLSPLGVRFVETGFYAGSTGRSGNLLIIGGGKNNELAKQIVNDLQNVIIFEQRRGKHSIFRYDDKIYGCKHENKIFSMNAVTRDHGIIVRRTRTDKSVVLLLAGIHMHGTLAAAQVAIKEKFKRRVIIKRPRYGC